MTITKRKKYIQKLDALTICYGSIIYSSWEEAENLYGLCLCKDYERCEICRIPSEKNQKEFFPLEFSPYVIFISDCYYHPDAVIIPLITDVYKAIERGKQRAKNNN